MLRLPRTYSQENYAQSKGKRRQNFEENLSHHYSSEREELRKGGRT
jgi:hypothetical protein